MIKKEVLAGRKAIEKYRKAHCGPNCIYTTAKTPKDIALAHNKLMAIMLEDLATAGFKSLQEFGKADREQQIKEGKVLAP